MMTLAGYPEDIIETNSSGRTMQYRPSGCLTVSDNSVAPNMVVPVKNVLVKCKRWFKLNRVYTNSVGCFTAGTEFHKKAKVIVKFKNNMAVVRGINHELKAWQYVFPVKKKLGLYERSAMQNISYNFKYASNANTLTALCFTAAHSMNALFDFRQYSVTHGLLGYAPGTGYPINIWISTEHTSRDGAPMLRAIARSKPFDMHQIIYDVVTFLFTGKPVAFVKIVLKLAQYGIEKNFTPDIIMSPRDPATGNTRLSADINGIFFHEYGHAMHYNQVGDSYWKTLNETIKANGGYGTKTSPNSGYIAVAESWAYFIGRTCNANRYEISKPEITNNLRNQLEFQTPSSTVAVQFPTSTTSTGWIPFGMVHDLIDLGEPWTTGVTDNVSNYTINGIFKGYNASATTVQTLRQQILNQNNNNQSTQVNQLVSSYGW